MIVHEKVNGKKMFNFQIQRQLIISRTNELSIIPNNSTSENK